MEPPLVESVRLGDVRFDIRHRALVMGVLNRTTDSFYDKGSYYSFDAFLAKADELVTDGADLLDVGGVKAGPGVEVGLEEELDRVVPAVEALTSRFDLPLSVDTWRAAVLEAACTAGAVVGNDISGFADPAYLGVAAATGASVVATHMRLQPRVADPHPEYDHLVDDVRSFLSDRAQRAIAAGIPADRVIVDAGLDLGKTWSQSIELLRSSAALADLGFPLLLSASNKAFIGGLLDLEVADRRMASHAAHAIGIVGGCRMIRVHDVKGARRTVDVLAAILGARHTEAPNAAEPAEPTEYAARVSAA